MLCWPEMATASNADRVLFYPTKRGVAVPGTRRAKGPRRPPRHTGRPVPAIPPPSARPGWPTAGPIPAVTAQRRARGSGARAGLRRWPPLRASQVAGGPTCPARAGATGGLRGYPPRKILRAMAKSAQKPTKIGRRRVATGANHPASHSSAFRRGPGTPAGAPTGDQSTVCMLHRNPPLCVKTGLPVAARRGCFSNRGPGRHHRA